MANSKFDVDGPAFERSTSEVVLPHNIMLLHEVEAGVGYSQILPSPVPGSPAPQEEQGRQAREAQEDPVLKWILEGASNPRHELRDYEHYSLIAGNSESDCEVPEDDELNDEPEDLFSDDSDQLVAANLQDEEGSTEGDHEQLNPVIIPVDDTIANEKNVKPREANVPVSKPEDPSIPRHVLEIPDNTRMKKDQLVPMNSQEAKRFAEEDQAIPVNIPVKDTCSEEDELIPAQLQGIHHQPSPEIIPVGNETGPVNLHLMVVHVDPANPLDVDFHATITATSASGGGSISSNGILMDTDEDA